MSASKLNDRNFTTWGLYREIWKMRSFRVEFKPRYQFSIDGVWIVRPSSPRDWKKHEYPKIRVWQVSKHSWRWSVSAVHGSKQGRATTKDQAVQTAIRFNGRK